MSTRAYQKLMLGQRPVLYWPFGEPSGAAAGDWSPNGRAGTYVGGPTLGVGGAITGDADTAVDLSGGTKYVNSTYNPWSGTITICGWAKRNTNAGLDALASNDQGGVSGIFFLCKDAASGQGVQATLNGFGTSATWGTASLIPLGQWFHWAFVIVGGSTVEFFLNGASQGAQPISAFPAAPGILRAGQDNANGGIAGTFDGSLDEFAVFARALTPAELVAQAKAGAPAVPALDPTLSPPVRVVSIHPLTRVSYDLTGLIEGLTYSSVNPGGDESAGFTYVRTWAFALPELAKGMLLRITAGLDVVWQGRIEEADRSAGDAETVAVTAYGLGTRLKDETMRQIFVDRDLSRWQGMSRGRQLAWLAFGNTTPADGEETFDRTGGLPAIKTGMTGAWTAAGAVAVESWYDAGPSLAVASIYFDMVPSSNIGAGWEHLILVATDDVTSNAISQTLTSGAAASGYFTPSTPEQFACLRNHIVTATFAGAEGVDYFLMWRNPAVYGNHGLSPQGADPGGFTTDQIVGYVLSLASGITQRRLDAQSYILPHFIVTEPTHHEDVIAEAAAVVQVDWGTWGPNSPLDNSLNGYFDLSTQDRATSHWTAYRRQAEDLDLHSETATLFNAVDVAYSDAAGSAFVETRTASVPELDQMGITRTASINAGTSTQAGAQALGDLFLALFGGFAPARGSVSIAQPLRHYRRGQLSPVYMRADGSNLKLADVLPTQTLLALDSTPDRRATFPMKRVEVDLSGAVPVARVELDQASDALAALEARLALAAQWNAGPMIASPEGGGTIATGGANEIAGYRHVRPGYHRVRRRHPGMAMNAPASEQDHHRRRRHH